MGPFSLLLVARRAECTSNAICSDLSFTYWLMEISRTFFFHERHKIEMLLLSRLLPAFVQMIYYPNFLTVQNLLLFCSALFVNLWVNQKEEQTEHAGPNQQTNNQVLRLEGPTKGKRSNKTNCSREETADMVIIFVFFFFTECVFWFRAAS